jgi:MoaA/NifB/PqqE/SkfB family radical SAM enzyme
VSPLRIADERPAWIGPGGRTMERLELHLEYRCPERCLFCSEAGRMKRFEDYEVTFGRVARVLRTHAGRGVRALHLTGGEPTLHPRFLDVLRLAKRLRLRTSVGSIGTRLCRRDFAQEALPLLDEVLLSLHGPDAETHDELVGRTGSFDRVVAAAGLSRQLRPALDLFVNTVVTRATLPRLDDTLRLADSLGAKLIVVSNLSPEGAGLDRFEELAPRLDELAAVLPRLPTAELSAVVRIFGVPLCLLGDRQALSNDLHWDPRVTVEWAASPGRVFLDSVYSWLPTRGRTHVDACAGCSRAGLCAGVWSRYAELWPVDGLEALP